MLPRAAPAVFVVAAAVLAGACAGTPIQRSAASLGGAAGRGRADGARGARSRGLSALPIVPLRLVATAEARGEDTRMDFELRGDGEILAHGQPIGRIVGPRLVDADGREVIVVLPDGAVVIQGEGATARMLASDEILFESGNRLAVDGDGRPVLLRRGRPPEPAPARFVGLRPSARRTALVLTLFIAMVDRPPPEQQLH